jgi:hypothetical protein
MTEFETFKFKIIICNFLSSKDKHNVIFYVSLIIIISAKLYWENVGALKNLNLMWKN